MRLWSIHPKHLDAKGLVALWREGLLARHVLQGLTRGYRQHPQLDRFRDLPDPVAAIDVYLTAVLEEAKSRGYAFTARKIRERPVQRRQTVTDGQLNYEWQHLLAKLAKRDPERWAGSQCVQPTPHPLFRIVPGPLASWERVAVSRERK